MSSGDFSSSVPENKFYNILKYDTKRVGRGAGQCSKGGMKGSALPGDRGP
jgi:hypothetical protein